jgi:hypothetical protein
MGNEIHLLSQGSGRVDRNTEGAGFSRTCWTRTVEHVGRREEIAACTSAKTREHASPDVARGHKQQSSQTIMSPDFK